MGYRDSSNLYSFAGGDPVNSRDPLGLAARRVGDEGGEEEESSWKKIRQGASMAAGFIPVVGDLLDVAQVATGYDIIAGERLSAEDRAIAAAAMLIPGASAAMMRYGAKGLRTGAKMFRHADEIADIAEAVAKRGDDLADAGKRGLRNADETGSLVQAGAKRTARREAQQEAAERAGRQMDPQTAKAPKKDPINCDVPWKCFAAGTLVATPEGDRAIEEIEAGDEVWAASAAGETPELGKVAALFSREVSEVWVVETANARVETTDEHPFWVDGAGWTQASDVREGDDLKTKDGTLERVTAVLREQRTAKVLNFEVTGYHNYFVSNAELLVHNCTGKAKRPSIFASLEKRRTTIYKIVEKETGRTVYVGKTVQKGGGARGMETRLRQHIIEKGWDPDKYVARRVARGNWTPFEAAAHEMKAIVQHGGLATLKNTIRSITPKKFDLFKHLHKDFPASPHQP